MKRIVMLSILLITASVLFCQNKYALLIGNDNYQNGISILSNPVTDVTDISSSLKSLGFTATVITNITLRDMLLQIDAFLATLEQDANSEGFFWFAGHGLAVNDKQFMFPIDISIESESMMVRTGYSVDELIEKFKLLKNKSNLIVIDACRNIMIPGMRNVGSRGLSVLNNTGIKGIKIVYSTMQGKTALDGRPGSRNSPFAEAFLKNMQKFDSFENIFIDIANDTLQLTNGLQEPYPLGYFSLPNYSINSNYSPDKKIVSINAMDISPDGKMILFGDQNGYIFTLDKNNLRKDRFRSRSQHPDIRDIKISPDGEKFLFRSPDSVSLYNGRSAKIIAETGGFGFVGYGSASFSPDSNNVAVIMSFQNGTVIGGYQIFDVNSHDAIKSFDSYFPGRHVFDYSGQKLLGIVNAELNSGQLIYFDYNKIEKNDRNDFDGQAIWKIDLRELFGRSYVRSLILSPDGKILALGLDNGSVIIVDVDKGEILYTLSGHSASVDTIAFSPDGKFLFSGSYDNTIKIWNLVTGKEAGTLFGHSGSVTSLVYDNSTNTVISSSLDGTIRWWDITEGKEIKKYIHYD